MDIVRHITVLDDSLFHKRCQIDEYPIHPEIKGLEEGIKYYTGVTAFVLGKMGRVEDVVDKEGHLFHLDRDSYKNYKKTYEHWFVITKIHSPNVEKSIQKFKANMKSKNP